MLVFFCLSLGGGGWLRVHCAAGRPVLSDTVPRVHLPRV